MNSDCTLTGNTSSGSVLEEGTPKYTTEVMLKEEVAESRKEESDPIEFEFKFPNIFDIFSSIF